MGKGFAVEVDVQCAARPHADRLSRRELDRLTAEKGLVASGAPRRFPAFALRNSNDRILTLPALLSLVDGRVPLLLEVKSTWRREGKFEANIAAMLATYKGPVAVMSFDPHVLAAFRKAAEPAARTGRRAVQPARRLPAAHRRRALRHAPSLERRHRLAPLHRLRYRALPALAPLIARNLFGLPLLTWTVRTDEERERALRYADAMIFEGIKP